MVISVSRRCDIPRFKFGWFLERLEAGYIEAANPFNPLQKRLVSLLPAGQGRPPAEGAELLVFWTRDPAFILQYAEELEKRGYSFYTMVTLNSYPALLEPNAPSPDAVIETMKLLARKITSSRLIWRYDPVFLSNLTDYWFHRRNFADLAARLKGAVNRVIVSVYDEYMKTERRLLALEQSGALKRLPHYGGENGGCRPLLPALRNLLADLARIAKEKEMEIQSCAEEDLSDCGIKAGACIDGEYIAKHFGLNVRGKDKGQKRSRCLCAQSVDIGSYGHCPATCVYCYGLRS
jgi:hypothetical protein